MWAVTEIIKDHQKSKDRLPVNLNQQHLYLLNRKYPEINFSSLIKMMKLNK